MKFVKQPILAKKHQIQRNTWHHLILSTLQKIKLPIKWKNPSWKWMRLAKDCDGTCRHYFWSLTAKTKRFLNFDSNVNKNIRFSSFLFLDPFSVYVISCISAFNCIFKVRTYIIGYQIHLQCWWKILTSLTWLNLILVVRF